MEPIKQEKKKWFEHSDVRSGEASGFLVFYIPNCQKHPCLDGAKIGKSPPSTRLLSHPRQSRRFFSIFALFVSRISTSFPRTAFQLPLSASGHCYRPCLVQTGLWTNSSSPRTRSSLNCPSCLEEIDRLVVLSVFGSCLLLFLFSLLL